MENLGINDLLNYDIKTMLRVNASNVSNVSNIKYFLTSGLILFSPFIITALVRDGYLLYVKFTINYLLYGRIDHVQYLIRSK